MCGCNDCKNPRQPLIIVDWSQIPDKFNHISVDGCTGQIWLYTDAPVFSLTGQGGKFMPVFPYHANEYATCIGHVTQTPDKNWHAIGHAVPLYGIPKLQISMAWAQVGRYFEESLTHRPCKSRSAS